MTHYETLGVAPDATPQQIKAAFRNLVSLHHPDRGGDKEISARINDAYAVLSDSERRARYDAGGRDDAPLSAEEILAKQALQILHKAMHDALERPDIEQVGLIRTVRDVMQQACTEIDGKAQESRKAAKRLERVKAKLKRKSSAGDDLVAMVIDGKIADALRAASAADDGLKQFRAAKALLDAYEVEVPPAHVAGRHPQLHPWGSLINGRF